MLYRIQNYKNSVNPSKVGFLKKALNGGTNEGGCLRVNFLGFLSLSQKLQTYPVFSFISSRLSPFYLCKRWNLNICILYLQIEHSNSARVNCIVGDYTCPPCADVFDISVK